MQLPQGLFTRLTAFTETLTPARLAMLGGAVGAIVLGVGLFASGVFGHGLTRLNAQIESGNAAKALSTLEEELAANPDDPAYNLLALKARLALCHERSCVDENPDAGALPPLLAGIPQLAARVTAPVVLEKDTPPLTLDAVFTEAMQKYETANNQPAAVLALHAVAPTALRPSLANGLFQPALTQARQGTPESSIRASQILGRLAKAQSLPETYTFAAGMMSGMFVSQQSLRNTNLIALRSSGNPPLPATAAALLPWAIRAEGTVSSTTAAEVLNTLPARMDVLNLEESLAKAAIPAMAQELLTASQSEATTRPWTEGLKGDSGTLKLAVQRAALMLDPNQPDLWATYLPALVSATLTQPSSSLSALADGGFSVKAGTISSESMPKVAGHVLGAAHKLQNTPGLATPLALFASHLTLTKQQSIELEKLTQALLLKAAEQGDVTSTVVLAESLPGVAQNNRQSVVPLLVKFIRDNLRTGNFTAATNTADLLTNTLQMDIEFAPLVLEEFTDDLKRRNVLEQLNATSPTALLEPQEQATLDLGPLFTFMQDYFADQPKVITAQLTTLVAEATGTYGQANAMYRLGASFPAETMPPEKQHEWLAASLEAALLADTTMDAATLAQTSARLVEVHPLLNLAPLMEAAIKRSQSLEDQRALWQAATPQVREVLRAIRPEFTALMQGIDALAANRLGAAAQSLATIETPQWRTEAQPFIEQFTDRLLDLSGVYVPVSAVSSLKTAAILLSPAALQGGKLTNVSVTFISRMGTLSEAEPTALRTNAAATHRFGLTVPYNFDTRSLTLSSQAIAQTPSGGTFNATYGPIRSLKLQTSEDATTGQPTSVLTVTLSNGAATPFVRTLLNPEDALRPDGSYALQTRLTTAASATQNILPPGSMLTLATENAFQKPPADADTKATQVMPLTGTLRHPASPTPITFSGYFEPETLLSTFIFNYPLPQSAQPAKAAVRCQALAGPITCGTHNLNSARQAYAAMVSGLQTRESLAASAAARSNMNSLASSHIMANLVKPQDVSTTSTSGTTVTPTATVTSSLPESLPTMEKLPVQAEPSKTAPVVSPTEVSTTAPAETKTSSTEPEPGAFINRSTKTSSMPATTSDTEPGTFINRSGGKSAATSSTNP